MGQLHSHAAENLHRAQERQSQYYNAGRRDVNFQVGDLVWKRNKVLSSAAQGIATKLAPKFAAPYTVTKVLGSNTYELADTEQNTFGPVHTEQLKPYVTAEVDDICSQDQRPPRDETTVEEAAE